MGAGYWGTSADPVSLGPSGVTGVCVVISLQSPLEERHHGEKQHQVRASRVWGTRWTDAGVIGRGQKGQVRGEISFRVWASQICDAHATPECTRQRGDGTRASGAGREGWAAGGRVAYSLIEVETARLNLGLERSTKGGEAREEAPDGALGAAENPGRAGGNQAREMGAEWCPSAHTHMWKSYPPPPNHRT